jgi:hypothetical protein
MAPSGARRGVAPPSRTLSNGCRIPALRVLPVFRHSERSPPRSLLHCRIDHRKSRRAEKPGGHQRLDRCWNAELRRAGADANLHLNQFTSPTGSRKKMMSIRDCIAAQRDAIWKRAVAGQSRASYFAPSIQYELTYCSHSAFIPCVSTRYDMIPSNT